VLAIRPDGVAPEITSITSTRYGGFSKSPYASMNMGFNVDDNFEAVYKNIALFTALFGIKRLVTLNQVHGDKIEVVDRYNFTEKIFADADGLFTADKGVALGIKTADCYNVQLIGESCIANLHCGWRSLAGGIIQNSLTLFKEHGDYPVQGVIGPGICGDCYEIGQEVADGVKESCGKDFSYMHNEGLHIDLRKAVEEILVINGIEKISHIPYCSACSNFLYSYRRDGAKSGRMLSVIMRG